MNVLVRCDGSVEIGMGHVVRCLALAEEMRDRYRCNITFAMRGSELGISEIDKIFPVIKQKNQSDIFNYEGWLKDCIKETQAQILIFDARDGFSREALRNIKRLSRVKVAAIEDIEDKRLEADLAFYPPVPQVRRMDWNGFPGELYTGWEWVILRKEFDRATVERIDNSQLTVPSVLVTMGGSDHYGMTLKAVKALEMLDECFNVNVVLGIGFQHNEELNKLLSHCKHRFNIHNNVQNMPELMMQSDIAIASFGVTAYELAAMGVPAIYLCLTEDHAESALIFVREKAAVSLGELAEVSDLLIAKELRQLLRDRGRILEMADRARRLVDGQGLERVVRTIFEKFKGS